MGKKCIQREFENYNGDSVSLMTNTFPGRKSVKLLTRLIRIKTSFAEGLEIGGLPNGEKSGFSFGDIDFGKLIKTIGDNIDDPKLFDLIMSLFYGASVSGKLDGNDIIKYDIGTDDGFDKAFDSDIPLMLEMVAFIIYENWGNLFKKKTYLNIKNMFIRP